MKQTDTQNTQDTKSANPAKAATAQQQKQVRFDEKRDEFYHKGLDQKNSSRLWTEECGGEIWADLGMPLTHFGNRAFKGHVGTLVAKKND